MKITLPDDLELRVDDGDVAIVMRGRVMLRIVEHEAVELGAALQACGRVLAERRAALDPKL